MTVITRRTRRRFILCATAAFCGCALIGAQAQKLSLGELLNWKPRPQNICYGVFLDPTEVANTVATKGIDQSPMSITSSNPATLSLNGQSTLSGNVTINQPGRLLRANKATFNRNPKTQTIDRIELSGNVRYFEQHQELAGQRVLIIPNDHALSLWDGAYRMKRDAAQQPLTAWGTAKWAQNLPKQLKIQEATYSTCPLCTAPIWQLHASKLDLDKEAGVGVAKHVSLHIKNVPILYWPYLSFPIDKRRKSGFLLPTPGHNDKDGFILEAPYYWNIAPNYDAQLTPILYSNRGVQLNGSFRYLGPHSRGMMGASFLPHDQVFAEMQDHETDTPDPDSFNQPFIGRLDNASTNRKQLSLHHANQFLPSISTDVTLNYVSDDYYLQDFGHNPIEKNSDQLLNQANFRYADNHWDFLSRLQIHQTLHPLDSDAKDPYERLPQLNLRGDWLFEQNYPHLWVNSEFIYFDHRRDFLTDLPVVTGQRLDIRPGIELPLKNAYAYFTPHIDVEGTFYSLHHQAPGTQDYIARVLPITTIDTGLFFERTQFFGSQRFTQTLEPRAYYVYIPLTNQNDIPLFDTDLPTFTYQQLFIPNRFSGYDRINDANQITLALTTRFLKPDNGSERFSATLASQLYFHHREVCLTPDCHNDPLINNNASPLIGAVNYHFSNQWYAIANIVWDPSDQRLTTANSHLHYQGEGNRLLTLGYDYVRDGDEKLGARSQDLSRFDVAVALPITERLEFLGNLNYNISHSHPQFYLLGLEYQSCCFALRGIISRTLIEQSMSEETTFDNRYYVQINFKGLSTVGNSNPNSMLKDRLPGFHDWF